jgi:hypothetical protein
VTDSKTPAPAEDEGTRLARDIMGRLMIAQERLLEAEIPEGEVEKAVDEHLAAVGLRRDTIGDTGWPIYRLMEEGQ